MAADRAQWGSKFGFVMAAAGSAVGLGNLWKFPYVTWENNGGAFVLVYLAATVVLGLPIMMSEILVGRKAQLSAVPAFEKLGGRKLSIIGWTGVVAGGVILSYYMVIAGWSLKSFWQCLNWSLTSYVQPGKNDFDIFLANGPLQIGLTLAFSVLTSFIVYRGIGSGIEKATKVLMPVLVGIMLYLVGTSLTMDGRFEALSMIFVPRFGSMPAEGYLEAVGQAFFSLSLGLGAMVAYGSYMGKKQSIFGSAVWVVLLDTVFALLACIAMFTIILSVPGLKESVSDSTVGMLFVVLPDLFYQHMPGGNVLAPLFFVLVGFAALSSTISLGEVVTSLMIDRRGWSRRKAVLVCSSVVFVGSIMAALSLGAVKPLSSVNFTEVPILNIVFSDKKGVLSLLDHLAANWLLPLGGFGITIFVGWILNKKIVLEEMGMEKPTFPFRLWMWSLKIIAPAAIIALIIAVCAGKDFS